MKGVESEASPEIQAQAERVAKELQQEVGEMAKKKDKNPRHLTKRKMALAGLMFLFTVGGSAEKAWGQQSFFDRFGEVVPRVTENAGNQAVSGISNYFQGEHDEGIRAKDERRQEGIRATDEGRQFDQQIGYNQQQAEINQADQIQQHDFRTEDENLQYQHQRGYENANSMNGLCQSVKQQGNLSPMDKDFLNDCYRIYQQRSSK